MLEAQTIAAILESIHAEHGGLPLLQFRLDDPRIAPFLVCSNHGLPAANLGQSRDCRWSLAGGKSLHAHWHDRAGVVRFHVDVHDPRIAPVAHLLADTQLPLGIAVGAVLGGALGGGWIALLGAIAGGLAGSQLPRGIISVWRLLGYRSPYEWRAECLTEPVSHASASA